MNDCISARVFDYDFTNPHISLLAIRVQQFFEVAMAFIHSFLECWLGWWKQPSRQTVVKPLSGLFWLRPFPFEGEKARVHNGMRPGTHK